MPEALGSLLIVAVVLGAIAAFAFISLIGWRIMYRTVKPSEADVVTGRGAHMSKETRDRLEADRQRLIDAAKGDPTLLRRVPEVPDFKIVRSGGYIKQPGQVVTTVNRAIHRAAVKTTSLAKGGVPITVEATVLYRVGDSELSIARYASRFDDEGAMIGAVEDVFEGKAREVLATLSVTQIQEDRESFGESVRSACTDDFDMLGLNIENFTIKEVSDSNGYLQALGEKDIAEVKKQARIATALNEQLAATAEAESRALTAESEAAAATREAQAKAESDKIQAKVRAEAEAELATAAQAGPLAQAKAQQEVIKQETENERLNAELEDERLKATVYKQADAAKYQVVKQAEADSEVSAFNAEAQAKMTVSAAEAAGAAQIAEAKAAADSAALRAEAVQKQGEAQAAADKALGLAQAEITEKQGLATAASARALGLAKAEALAAEGAAMTENQEAMLGSKLVDVLPQVVAANAQSYSRIGSLTVLDGMDGVNGGLHQTMVTALSMIPTVFGAVRNNGSDPDGGASAFPFNIGGLVQNFGGQLADDIGNAARSLPAADNAEVGPVQTGRPRATATMKAEVTKAPRTTSGKSRGERLGDDAEKIRRRAASVDPDALLSDAQGIAGDAFDTADKALDFAEETKGQAEALRDRVASITR